MHKAITVNWKLLGAELAGMGDEEQGKFFEGFAKELDAFTTHTHKEMQMLYVCDKLSDEAKATLEKYFPALWYKE